MVYDEAFSNFYIISNQIWSLFITNFCSLTPGAFMDAPDAPCSTPLLMEVYNRLLLEFESVCCYFVFRFAIKNTYISAALVINKSFATLFFFSLYMKIDVSVAAVISIVSVFFLIRESTSSNTEETWLYSVYYDNSDDDLDNIDC